MAKVVGFKIVLDGTEKVISDAKELKRALAAVRRELDPGKFGTDAYQKLAKAQKDLLQVNQRLKVKTRETKRDFEQLSAELATLTTRYNQMNAAAKKSFSGQQVQNQIANARNALNSRPRSAGGSFFGNVKEQFDFFLRGGIAINAVNTLFNSIERLGAAIVDVNSKTSDLLAEIQRVAGLTRAEVRALFDTLEGLDTRTPTLELLEFAAIGGRLGVAKDQLDGFAIALDKIRIATAGQLGDNAEDLAASLGKINNVFNKPGEGDDIGQQLTEIGNAIVYLDNVGIASAPFLTDFAQRMAGLRTIASLTLGDTLGLASGFEELGQTSEVSSTAMNSIILQIGKNIPAAADLAGLSVEELRDLFERDATQAVLAFSKGIVESSEGTEELTRKLKDFKIDGRRAVAIVGALGGNYDLFQKRIREATAALESNSSITDAVILKQETLAGRTERLKNQFLDLLNSPGVQDFLGGIVRGAALALSGIEKLANSPAFKYITDATARLVGLGGLDKVFELFSKFGDSANKVNDLRLSFADQRTELEILDARLPELLSKYNELNFQTTLTVDEQTELARVIKEIGDIVPGAVTRQNEYGEAVAFSTDQVVKLTAAQREAANATRTELLAGLREQSEEIRGQIADQEEVIRKAREALASQDSIDPIFSKEKQGEILEANARIKTLTGTLNELQNEINDINRVSNILGESFETINRRLAGFFSGSGSGGPEEVARTVAAIKDEIKELETALGAATNREEASVIQSKIAALKRELAAILGEDSVKGFKKDVDAARGSIEYFEKKISELEDKLGKTANAQEYVRILRQISDLTNELIFKQREFNEAAITSAGGSVDPGLLPTTNIRNVQGALQEISDNLFLGAEVPEEQRQKILEISEEMAKEINEIFLKRRKDRFEEEVKIELDLHERKRELFGDTIAEIGELTGDVIDGSIESLNELLKETMLLFLKLLEQILIAEVQAKALVAGIGNPVNAAVALGQAAITTGIIKASFAAIRGVINAAASAEQGIVFDGREGHTGHGSSKQPAGMIAVHKDEVVQVWPQRVLHSPRGQRLMSDFQDLRKRMGYQSGRRVAGFEQGGISSLVSPSPAQNAITIRAIVTLDDNSVERVETAVRSGSEGGSMKGIKEAAKESRRRDELTRKTGF